MLSRVANLIEGVKESHNSVYVNTFLLNLFDQLSRHPLIEVVVMEL